MVGSTADLADLRRRQGFHEQRVGTACDGLVADAQPAVSVASHCVHVVLAGYEGGMLKATRDLLDNDAERADSRN